MTSPLESRAYPSDPTMPSVAPSGYVTPTTPANPSRFEPPMTSAEIETQRGNFYELLLQQIVRALTGFFLPGAGSAFSQLGNFAAGIPLIGPIVQAITGVIGGTIETIGNFFGNLLGFLPGNFNEDGGTFNPIGMAVDFISSILNPSNLLGSLFSPGLIPGIDASKIISGELTDTVTGLGNLRQYLGDGFSGAVGLPGWTNENIRSAVAEAQALIDTGYTAAMYAQSGLAGLNGAANANAGVGGTFQVINPLNGAAGANGASLG